MIARIVTVAALICATPAVATPMECVIAQKEQCQPGSPCRTLAANRMWNKVNLTAHTYAR